MSTKMHKKLHYYRQCRCKTSWRSSLQSMWRIIDEFYRFKSILHIAYTKPFFCSKWRILRNSVFFWQYITGLLPKDIDEYDNLKRIVYEISTLWRYLPQPSHRFCYAIFCRMSVFTRATGRYSPNKWRQTDLSPGMVATPYTAQIIPNGRHVERTSFIITYRICRSNVACL